MAKPKSRRGRSALLIIDMINTMDFPEGPRLLRRARPVAERIRRLKERFHARGLPVIYVNDHFGEWMADWRTVYEKCRREGSRGAELAELLEPDGRDFFVLKPRHSGFYGTPLALLLERLRVRRLVITGVAGNICVLFTAHEAHMRGYDVTVPADAIASNTAAEDRMTLHQLAVGLGLKTPKAERLP